MNHLINRQNYIQQLEKLKDKHIIKVVTGLRRSGKSTLFEIFNQQIRASGVSARNVQQYNFEKPIYPQEYTWRDICRFFGNIKYNINRV
jgi:uncharacterized protein